MPDQLPVNPDPEHNLFHCLTSGEIIVILILAHLTSVFLIPHNLESIQLEAAHESHKNMLKAIESGGGVNMSLAMAIPDQDCIEFANKTTSLPRHVPLILKLGIVYSLIQGYTYELEQGFVSERLYYETTKAVLIKWEAFDMEIFVWRLFEWSSFKSDLCIVRNLMMDTLMFLDSHNYPKFGTLLEDLRKENVNCN